MDMMKEVLFSIAFLLIMLIATVWSIHAGNERRLGKPVYVSAETKAFYDDTMTARVIIRIMALPFVGKMLWDSLTGQSVIPAGSIVLIFVISQMLHDVLFVRPLERRLFSEPDQDDAQQ